MPEQVLVRSPQQKTTVYVTASFLDTNHLYVDNLDQQEIGVCENGQPASLKIECTRPGVMVKNHPVAPILQ